MNSLSINRAAARRTFECALESHAQVMGQFFLARLLGLELEYDDHHCTIGFDVADFMLNPQGTLHGGVIALVMDVSMGHLLAKLQGPGATLEMKTQYLSAVTHGRARVVGSILRRGRNIWFLESRFFTSEGDLAAFSTSTWKLLA